MTDRVGINGFARIGTRIGRMVQNAMMEGDDPNQLVAKPWSKQGKSLTKPFRYAAAFEIILLITEGLGGPALLPLTGSHIGQLGGRGRHRRWSDRR